jgi:hypothetical protein
MPAAAPAQVCAGGGLLDGCAGGNFWEICLLLWASVIFWKGIRRIKDFSLIHTNFSLTEFTW